MRETLKYQTYIDIESILKSIQKCGKSYSYPHIPISFFSNLNKVLIDAMIEKGYDAEQLVSRGATLYIPEIGYEYQTKEDVDENLISNVNLMRQHYMKIGQMDGFYVENVLMKVNYNGPSVKGLQSKLVTQAMDHAMHDNYDILFLVADDNEFEPLVYELRSAEHLKYVYHVGLKQDKLCASSYGHINLSEKLEALLKEK